MSLLLHCHCYCSVTVTAVSLLLHCHCYCSVTVTALSLLLQCHCYCSVTVTAVSLLLQCHCYCSVTVTAIRVGWRILFNMRHSNGEFGYFLHLYWLPNKLHKAQLKIFSLSFRIQTFYYRVEPDESTLRPSPHLYKMHLNIFLYLPRSAAVLM